jgi:MSHA biogenesis protein MshI
MFGLLNKKLRANTLVAVCPGVDGVAVAQVRRERDVPPILELCAYQERDAGKSEEKVLQKINHEYHLDRASCVSMMELGSYNLLMVEAPDVQPEELRAAIRWKIKDLIDFHIDDSVVDVFEVPDTKGAAGRNRMMYVVVARTSAVKARIDLVLNANFQLSVVDIPELALRNVASLLPEDVGGVALVYIGHDKGLITITRQSTLYLSRRIEKGTDALPAQTLMHDTNPEVVREWLDGIIVEVQRSLDYYESHFSKPQVSSIIITPLARELDGVAGYVSEQLEIPARILDVNTLIDVQEPLDPAQQANCILAIGAALRKESMAL